MGQDGGKVSYQPRAERDESPKCCPWHHGRLPEVAAHPDAHPLMATNEMKVLEPR
jgi:hypothetical protein